MRRRPRSVRAFTIALAAGLLHLSACDERDRTNPLDPMNEETQGTPDWLRAVAENGAVELSWRAAPPNGFDAFEVFRESEASPAALIARVENPASIVYTDSAVENAREYTYRLDVVLDDRSRVALPEKLAMPGSAVPWVVESGAFGLLRFTPDGRNARTRTGSGGGHFDVVSAPDGSTVWAADYFGGQVQQYDTSGALLSTIGVSLPFRMAVDFSHEVVWAASWAVGSDPTLYAFELDGDEVGRFPLREEARDLVVSETTGACYVALGRGGGVARASVGDTLRASETSETVMMLALVDGDRLYGGDPLEGGVYGYDLETLAIDVTSPEITSPQSMTDGAGCVWVADGSARIVCLDRDLNVTQTLDGVGLVSGMDTDEETATLWLALPNAGRVFRMSTSGEILTTIALFQPFGVSIGRAPDVSAAHPRFP